MDKNFIYDLAQEFEATIFNYQGVGCWSARQLQALLGYSRWRNFEVVLMKAKKACQKAGYAPEDHFMNVKQEISFSGIKKEIEDVMLTRYAGYLIAQSADSLKPEISFARTYFSLPKRDPELLAQRFDLLERLDLRNKLTLAENELSHLIYEQGGNEKSFAYIRSKGDAALFGGYNTKDIKAKLGIPQNRALADFLPAITIHAKNLATEMTNLNIRQLDLMGENQITSAHVRNNQELRQTLVKRGIVPEELPPEEDIQKLKRRVASQKDLSAGKKQAGRN